MNIFKSIKRGLKELTSLTELSCNKECPKYDVCQCTLGGKTCEYPKYRDSVNVCKTPNSTDNYLNDNQDSQVNVHTEDSNVYNCLNETEKLVKELGEIQEKLSDTSSILNIQSRMNNEWNSVFLGTTNGFFNADTKYGLLRNYLYDCNNGTNFVSSSVMKLVINHLENYMEYTKQLENIEDTRTNLKKREQEIKEQLGIK